MISSQVQEPQKLVAPPSIRMNAGSPTVSTLNVKTENGKPMMPAYGAYPHQQVPALSPPMSATAMPEMDSQGRLYGMPFAFPSAFGPFYISLPGGPPMQMAAIPNTPPDMYQQMPQNLPHGQHHRDAHHHHHHQAFPANASPPDISVHKDSAAYMGHNPVAIPRSSPRTSASQVSQDAYPYRHKDPQLSKRTKVSRACDECRRKKTRCDVDAEHEVCTPCARAGVPCTFARAQLKRGPAKKRLSHGNLPLPRLYQSSQQERSPIARKPRSASDAVLKGLPPIETLLGQSPSTSASDNAQVNSASKSISDTSSSVPATSGFPMLVEVACRQSESPPNQEATLKAPALSNNSPHTPPAQQYDVGTHGISHKALMEYYTFLHPTFPLLPDLVSEFDAMFASAGPSKEYIVSALNGTSSNVPFGLGSAGTTVSPAARESHLIALLLTYLMTLDSTWLGASVAACTAMIASQSQASVKEPNSRLTALVVIFDRLHCAIFGTPSLAPEFLSRVAKTNTRLAPILKSLGVPAPVTTQRGQDEQFLTAPRAAIAILGKLGQNLISVEEAQKQMEPLIPQLHRTPLEQFASVLSTRQANTITKSEIGTV